MTDLSRRDFLKQVAQAGAGLQVALLCPGLAKASTAPKDEHSKIPHLPGRARGRR